MRNIETELVRIELSGVNFDIPINYMYGETIEKYNRWPEPKKERVKRRSISISVLLPDLRPYYAEDDAKWRVLGHGDRVEVSFASWPETIGWHKTFVELTKDEMNAGTTAIKTEIYGLTRFEDTTGRSTYLPQNKDRKLMISCAAAKGVKSPSCRAKSNFSDTITLEYYFGLDHLQYWDEIDRGLIRLFTSFSQKT